MEAAGLDPDRAELARIRVQLAAFRAEVARVRALLGSPGDS
jgi:hypothetical protein